MILKLHKIHHLIRYFILIGTGVFIGFIKRWDNDIVLYLIGPPLYLAHYFRNSMKKVIPGIPYEADINYYGFLLPVVLIYFALFGMLLKTLWNEHGMMRGPTFLAYLGFMVFMHYYTGDILLSYFQPYP